MLERQFYYPSPGPGIAPWHNIGYADAQGLRRVEILYHTTGSDEDRDWMTRTSEDNGRTWLPYVPIPDVVLETPRGGIAKFFLPPRHCPVTGNSYTFTMIRHWPGGKCFDYRVVNDVPVYTEHVWVSVNGGPNIMLRYEDGPELNPDNPFDARFCRTNTAYYSHLPAFGPRGEVYYMVHCFGDRQPSYRRNCLFRCETPGGPWLASNITSLSSDKSSVGMEEPEVVRFNDGRLMTVARGNSTPTMSGVKWMSLSTDGGKTISPPEPLRYDDGSLLHSPCSIHRFLRSSRTGKLYMWANILNEPAHDQEPRYPICIAEIDERKSAVVRKSVQVLDDRRPGEPPRLQLSNFHVIEDRETKNFELYITLLGANKDDFWGSDVYRYVFPPPA